MKLQLMPLPLVLVYMYLSKVKKPLSIDPKRGDYGHYIIIRFTSSAHCEFWDPNIKWFKTMRIFDPVCYSAAIFETRTEGEEAVKEIQTNA